MEQFALIAMALAVFMIATVDATSGSARQERAYGSWDSPISPELITAGQKGFGDLVVDGKDIYWSELRPEEKGRSALMRQRPDGTTEEVLPSNFNVRTRVHEYGGGAYTVKDGTVYFSNDKDQRVYVKDAHGVRPVTEEGTRFADYRVTRHGLIAIAEQHQDEGQAKNFLALVDPKTGSITSLAEGQDFYTTPALNSDETQIAWVSWQHPNMPWDEAELWVADLSDGKLTNSRRIAGSDQVAVIQPQWGPDDALYYVADPEGWWNLFRWDGKQSRCLHAAQAEFGFPHWVFGMSSYGFVGEQIFCTYTNNCIWQLALLDPRTGKLEDLAVEGCDFSGIRTGADFAVFHQGSPTASMRLVRLDLGTGKLSVLAENAAPALDTAYLSIAQPISFPSTGGRLAHAFYYPPSNPQFQAPEGSKPPLLVLSHGGPTSNTRSTLKLATQYWTSRGFAVLDVNYGGSTGYGRAYRQLLHRAWGIVDREDCEAGARHLADKGLVDPKKLAIRGGSAGGYTTLCCLTFGDVFTVGASYYGVSDCVALLDESHKFESRYPISLIGPYPEAEKTYAERSPSCHAEQLSCPVIFFQGDEDKIVPPNQSEIMVNALKEKGVKTEYHLFEGEQHGFRKAENIQTALIRELQFYMDVFGA